MKLCEVKHEDLLGNLITQLKDIHNDTALTDKFEQADIRKGFEPMTAFTDAVLAGWTLFLAAFLFSRANGRKPVTLWAWAFVFTGITSLAGVYYHICRLDLSFVETQIAWKVVPFSTGISMFFFGYAAAMAWLRPAARRLAVALMVVVIAGCLVWAISSNCFLVTIVESVPVLLALLTGASLRWADRASRFIVAGVLVTIFAAIVQATHLFGLEKIGGADFNVVFHIIELPANYFLFKGGLLLEEWRAK